MVELFEQNEKVYSRQSSKDNQLKWVSEGVCYENSNLNRKYNQIRLNL